MNSNEMEKLLQYNGKPLLICTLFAFVPSVITLIAAPFTNVLLMVGATVCAVWTLVFAVLYIAGRRQFNHTLNKYDINELKSELETGIKLDGTNTYMTENYIISNNYQIKITEYSEIEFVYPKVIGGIFNSNFTQIKAYLKNGKNVIVIARLHYSNQTTLFNKISQKNSNAVIGNTPENIKKYETINPGYKRQNFTEKIIACLVVMIIIFVTVYSFIE